MKRPADEVLAQGLGGGILAGVVVAVWFFVVDLVQGQPFHTPAVLANVFIQRDMVGPSVGLVLFYTVLHLGVFATLGILIAWTLAAVHAAPGLLLGAAFGVLVLDLVFYGALLVTGGSLLATGARVFGVLPWPHVLAANVAGGIVLMAYLHRASGEERPFGLAALRGHPVLTEGIVTGLIGGLAVAIWFFVLDVGAGEPFRTPAALGSALFLGAQSGFEVTATPALVAGYSVLHFALFAAVGVLFEGLARGLQQAPRFILIAVLALIVLSALVTPTMALTAAWVMGDLGWWSVLVGNALAGAVMGWRIWRRHPALRRALRRPVHVRV